MKKFLYTDDVTSRTTEGMGYLASEFTVIAAPNSPVMTGSNGLLDPSIIPAQSQSQATKLVISRIAKGDIVRGDAVRSYTLNTVTLADPTTNRNSASVLGVALNNAGDGVSVEVLILGIISDSIFSVFSVNTSLYLDVQGGITDERRISGYLTPIGKCLGGGEVLVNVLEPITLGG